MPPPDPHNRTPRTPLFRFDPGWLFLIAGLALIAAAVLIPAADDLARAEHHRTVALALEQHRADTLARHAGFAQHLDAREPGLLTALAADQLNIAPAGRTVLMAPARRYTGPDSAQLPGTLATLREPFVPPPAPSPPDSALQRLATGERSRLALIAVAALCVFYSLLPAARPRQRPHTAPQKPATAAIH